jgi:hypothetical protein
MTALQEFRGETLNPLDKIELMAELNDWPADRTTDDEMNLVVSGSWTNLHICLNWRRDLEGLHLACTFDLKVPPNRREEVARLVTLINEQLYFGHFDIWRAEGDLMFRDGLLLAGAGEISDEQCSALIRLAMSSCERYYPAFQYVIWAGKSAEEAIRASMLETVGEA